MIYTVTLNPSVDYIVKLEQFELGSLNRMTDDSKFPGGKGINVSRVMKRQGVESKAIGFLGGFTGAFIEDFLTAEKINHQFVKVSGDTRINIKLKTDVETEINGLGPSVSDEQLDQFLQQFEDMDRHDIVLLAGSIPGTLPSSIYKRIIDICNEKEIKVVADVSGDALKEVVSGKPFLIKPNHHELGELFDTKIETVEEAHVYAKKLVSQGVQHVIVSLAEKGALLVTEGNSFVANVPKGKVLNSVGAGDSVVGGFISAYSTNHPIEEAFKIGVASGSATAFSLELCTKEKMEELLPQIDVKTL
ncbi:1-phosphofructokinase [Metabacillus halosaccharovorans]|uniref:Tagatose-6-phosphate kinase n=1 Tax=Metabacillus halosaccharovorans TaxID=930124 RepID=A0ABT3DK86_9BACI|nr:1-phosphofructokinase [Metabacillus halosaccharovorans]MCV9887473.1 1-phosphofructokinase [Metabacillus halosaccharovorans]